VSVILFFLLAFAFTWALLPWAQQSMAVSLIALCGPAVAARVASMAASLEDRQAFRARLNDWRHSPWWYALALLLPLPISGFASLLEYVLGARGPIEPFPISALSMAVFVLVAGEEIGWRGFALPALLKRFGPWQSSAILGVVWAAWHYPLFQMPGMPQYGSPFLAFVPYTIALSVILTFLSLQTRGSVIIATLFHGAVNTFGLMNTAAGPEMRGWGNAMAYGLAAVVIVCLGARVVQSGSVSNPALAK
jgi:membrane protease YdiL (CAAX protease family)